MSLTHSWKPLIAHKKQAMDIWDDCLGRSCKNDQSLFCIWNKRNPMAQNSINSGADASTQDIINRLMLSAARKGYQKFFHIDNDDLKLRTLMKESLGAVDANVRMVVSETNWTT
ncbi:unnamed protein product [Aspergillus oryzae]|uniref:Unnamed protein product n=1 Tax=Aspergillus oryzae TaxID=5062 RepID=A0AAN4YDK5_ASPOZ|nr:unnamed protein product [Aspergillus oryzae]